MHANPSTQIPESHVYILEHQPAEKAQSFQFEDVQIRLFFSRKVEIKTTKEKFRH